MGDIERWWRVIPRNGQTVWTPEDPSGRLGAAWEGATVEGPFVHDYQRAIDLLRDLANEAAKAVCEPARFDQHDLGLAVARARRHLGGRYADSATPPRFSAKNEGDDR